MIELFDRLQRGEMLVITREFLYHCEKWTLLFKEMSEFGVDLAHGRH